MIIDYDGKLKNICEVYNNYKSKLQYGVFNYSKCKNIKDESKNRFIIKMMEKYKSYIMSDDEESISANQVSYKRFTTSNSSEVLSQSPENNKEKFLTGKDVEMIFPGHIKSYYASSEF